MSKYDAFDRISRTSRCYFALSLLVNCPCVVSGDGDRATVYATSRGDVLLQCIGPPRMHAVGRSPLSQPQYPIDRIKSLAGDVIVFGVRPLIILRTILAILPLQFALRGPSGAWQFIDCLMQCAAVAVVSVSLSVGLCGLLPVMDGITSRSLRQILSSVGEPATSSSVVGLVG